MVAWVVQSFICVMQNRKHARRLLEKFRPGRLAFRPAATVIMPIKGIDHDLPGCVRGLCTQDYPAYRVIIVVESPEDPAYPIVQAELAKYPRRPSQVMIAGQAGPAEGQKVHNQLHVLREILPAMDDGDALAFVDSDAIPGPHWLGEMTGRLLSKRVAVVTGYRWMVPDTARPASFWSHVASVINGSVACAQRRSDNDQAWGGAMAMMVSTAREGNLIGRLTGALTDDYPITRMARDLGQIVRYLPRSLAATPVDFKLRSFWAFARRQYVITRIYAPVLFTAGVGALTLWIAGALVTWIHFLYHIVTNPAGRQWWYSGGAIALVFLFNQVRASYRKQTVRIAFGDDMVRRLRPALLIDRWLTPLWMAMHWLIALSALSSNRFTWRGIRYQLDGPNDVKRLN